MSILKLKQISILHHLKIFLSKFLHYQETQDTLKKIRLLDEKLQRLVAYLVNDHNLLNRCNQKKKKEKKKRGGLMRDIYTTKIIEICINHNNDYYTIQSWTMSQLYHILRAQMTKKKKPSIEHIQFNFTTF